jgi:hypothetical protein
LTSPTSFRSGGSFTGPPIFLSIRKEVNAMRARNETINVVLEMLENGIPEEAIPAGLAAYAAVAGLLDADLPFAVAE